jgi:hypothetical protein
VTIFCDIDGTLTRDGEHKWGAINSEHIEAINAAKKNGHYVVLWSARGAAYAKAFARRYHVDANLCIGKPDVCFDDHSTIRPPEKMQVLPPDQLWPWMTAHGVPREA